MSHREVPKISAVGIAFDIGDTALIGITIRDADGELYDPGMLTVQVQPSGGESETFELGTDPELVQDGEGLYTLSYPIATAVKHQVRIVATGEGEGEGEMFAGAEPGYFDVRPTNIEE